MSGAHPRPPRPLFEVANHYLKPETIKGNKSNMSVWDEIERRLNTTLWGLKTLAGFCLLLHQSLKQPPSCTCHPGHALNVLVRNRLDDYLPVPFVETDWGGTRPNLYGHAAYELPQAAHLRHRKKNSPSATSDSQKARGTPKRGISTLPQAPTFQPRPGLPVGEVPVRSVF